MMAYAVSEQETPYFIVCCCAFICLIFLIKMSHERTHSFPYIFTRHIFSAGQSLRPAAPFTNLWSLDAHVASSPTLRAGLVNQLQDYGI